MNELVSVIIPAYNASPTIDETLASVCAQTWRYLDIIVVDDGSTDDTAEKVLRKSKEDSRIRLITASNGGVARARNLGIEAAKGGLIAPVDADDLWHPEKIESQVALMGESGPQTGLIYTWYCVIDETSRIIGYSDRHQEEGDVLRRMCMGNLVGNGSSPLIRKTCLLEVGGYDPTLGDKGAQGCEDLKLYFAIARHWKFGVVKRYLTGYRWILGNMSSNGVRMLRSYDLAMNPFKAIYGSTYPSEFRFGRLYLIKWLLGRAIATGDFDTISGLIAALWHESPKATLKALALSPQTWLRHRRNKGRPGGHYLEQVL
ncbi:glycosyltransferase family 2 protein [Asticcacaulis sp. DW145]|uniref:glycosyltransferase family 2 protein n=1 Tax=Asticcacaulis sp. DW145 TaxID=3095608 RepID=UPI0030867F36|nr:glycosyltransferase family 2 protein [Asticcacaulis sp. DW145]